MKNMLHKNSEAVKLSRARNVLLWVWMGGAAVPFLILMIQTILGKYGNQQQEVWSWFAPTVFPSLALMIGVLGGTAMLQGKSEVLVNSSFFHISFGLSIFYLIVLSLTILLSPLSASHPIELYQASNSWITPLQGLVVAAIGFLFTSDGVTESGSDV